MTRAPRKRPNPSPTSPDPIEIAMEAEAGDMRPDSPARRVLLKHEKLTEEQIKLTRWQIASERAGFILKVLTGLAGMAVAIALAVMVWTASRASGLVIEPFSVPPALAERGLTGEAVARGLMDRWSKMVEIGRSGETVQQVSSNLDQGLSIQIPQTGISLSQLDAWLKSKLGHERRVTGEVVTGTDGEVMLIARSGSSPLPVQRGEAADFPALLQRSAEALYAQEQPRSYTYYLGAQGRDEDQIAFAHTRISLPSLHDRAIGYSMLGSVLKRTEGDLAAAAALRRGLAIDPQGRNAARNNLGILEFDFGHPETTYRLLTELRAMADRSRRRSSDSFSGESFRQRRLFWDATLARHVGDCGAALGFDQALAASDLVGVGNSAPPQIPVAGDHACLHDLRQARTVLAAVEPTTSIQTSAASGAARDIALASEDWPAALAAGEAQKAADAQLVDKGAARFRNRASDAMALIGIGRLDDAAAELESTPLDCQPCVQARGRLATARGDQRTADHWFGEAVRMAPSAPQANTLWGRALLDRGETEKAIERFTAANRQGPHFADPISFWGEALLKQGKAKAAVARFREADKYAPRWGRNHLLWGEALAKLGKGDEAREQFKLAAGLDLSAADRAELAKTPR